VSFGKNGKTTHPRKFTRSRDSPSGYVYFCSNCKNDSHDTAECRRNKKGKGGPVKGKRPQGNCFNCDEPGHFKYDCPKLHKSKVHYVTDPDEQAEYYDAAEYVTEEEYQAWQEAKEEHQNADVDAGEGVFASLPSTEEN